MPVVVDAAVSDWASLTFTGQRHCFVVRCPGRTTPADFTAAALDVAGTIVAVEAADWRADADGLVVTLTLLAIAVPAAGRAAPPPRVDPRRARVADCSGPKAGPRTLLPGPLTLSSPRRRG